MNKGSVGCTTFHQKEVTNQIFCGNTNHSFFESGLTQNQNCYGHQTQMDTVNHNNVLLSTNYSQAIPESNQPINNDYLTSPYNSNRAYSRCQTPQHSFQSHTSYQASNNYNSYHEDIISYHPKAQNVEDSIEPLPYDSCKMLESNHTTFHKNNNKSNRLCRNTVATLKDVKETTKAECHKRRGRPNKYFNDAQKKEAKRKDQKNYILNKEDKYRAQKCRIAAYLRRCKFLQQKLKILLNRYYQQLSPSHIQRIQALLS